MNRQPPSLHLTKRNPITDIPYQQRRTLCAKLDAWDDWKKFVGFIRSKDGQTPRYSDLHMCMFDKEKERRHGSPTDAVLNDWRTLRPTIGELVDLLVMVELKDSANYIHTDILRIDPIKEPVEGVDGKMVTKLRQHHHYANIVSFSDLNVGCIGKYSG